MRPCVLYKAGGARQAHLPGVQCFINLPQWLFEYALDLHKRNYHLDALRALDGFGVPLHDTRKLFFNREGDLDRQVGREYFKFLLLYHGLIFGHGNRSVRQTMWRMSVST